MEEIVSNKTGALGISHLATFYERCMAARRGERIETTAHEWFSDNVLLAGLGLPLETTIRYLGQYEPSFPEFENWIVEKNDGSVDDLTIERINCAINGESYDQKLTTFLQEIDEAEDALTSEDLRFWDENGYVIVREAVSRHEARAAETAVWEFLGMSPDVPETWYEKPIGKGIMTEFYHHPSLSATRRSRRVLKAFAQLWKTPDLWITTDRTSFNPPENERFKFPGPRLHFDMSLAPPHYFGTQGVLYLCDTAADQGAFSCVPGFHNELENWLTSLPAGTDARQVDLESRALPIAANAGDLIIWHQALPHGSSPNRGTYPRIVQYMNMYPLDRKENLNWL